MHENEAVENIVCNSIDTFYSSTKIAAYEITKSSKIKYHFLTKYQIKLHHIIYVKYINMLIYTILHKP